MEIRKGTMADLPEIMKIYEDARAYMRSQGNRHQWVNGYPDQAIVQADIAGGDCHLCVDNGEILGVFCYFQRPDPTYREIYGGQWLNDAPYGVIHRIAVRVHRRGVAGFCYDYALKQCPNLRIDTHRDNIPMQMALQKYGFSQCGIIYLANGDARLAYQKVL